MKGFCTIIQPPFNIWFNSLKKVKMVKEFKVRYGRNYKVVLAIILPSFSVVPFLLWFSSFRDLNEWQVWTIVFLFVGILISLSMWLVIRSYPEAVLSIRQKEISLYFEPGKFMSPADFSFNMDDIVSFRQGEIRGAEYFVFETRNPYRKFQLSSISFEVEEMLLFNEAMVEISENVNQTDGV